MFRALLQKSQNIISPLDNASYEAIRKWYHRAKDLFASSRKERRAIDETKIKVKQDYYYLWASIETDTWEILGVQLTKARSSFDALRFIRKVLRTCENKPKSHEDGSMVQMGSQQAGLGMEA